MTDDEAQEKLTELVNNIEKIFIEANLPLNWMLFLNLGSVDVHTGNFCPVCASDKIIEWIENNNIQHLQTEPETIN